MRIVLKVIGAFAVLVLILLAIGVGQLDRVVKEVVETVAPEFTRSDVTLDSVDISLSAGKGELNNLKIDNPEGFNAPTALSLGKILVDFDMDSLTTNTIIVNSVLIDAPQITYENGLQGSNLDVLQANIASYSGGSSAPSESNAGSESESTDSGKQVKIIIKDLQVSDGVIRYSNPLMGSSTLDVPLPVIYLTGIGEKSGGATAEEIVKLILNEINSGSIEAVGSSDLVKNIGDQARDIISEQSESLKGLLDSLK